MVDWLRKLIELNPDEGALYAVDRKGGHGRMTSPVTLEFQLPPGASPAGILAVHEASEREWTTVPHQFEPESHTLRIQVRHFSSVGWFDSSKSTFASLLTGGGDPPPPMAGGTAKLPDLPRRKEKADGFTKEMDWAFERLYALEGLRGVVADGGLIVFMQCFSSRDEAHLAFSLNLAQALFGDHSGTIITSTQETGIYELTNAGQGRELESGRLFLSGRCPRETG